jgi:class 3 adenylate cyclase/tetratricopeptide (TPR) repeat protein
MQCSICLTINREQAKFCAQCGYSVVSQIGNRMNKFGRRFCDLCGESLEGQANHFCNPPLAVEEGRIERIATADDFELKQVTVLFADISDSTRLISGLDPEHAWGLLDPILQIMIKAVISYEGTVNQIQGDGIMAVIGAPRALEDHALRGCYAALSMHQMVKQAYRERSPSIHLHIGIATGEALVGTIGSDINRFYNAMGDLIHLAARLQGIAKPGQTLCTEETVRQAGPFIVAQSLGSICVRGFDTTINVNEILSATDRRSRFYPVTLGRPLPCVGREEHQLRIRNSLDLALGFSGQVVALVGDAGVGKSRLVWEQVRSSQCANWIVLECCGFPFTTNSLYRPIADLLRHFFQIEQADIGSTICIKVAAGLSNLDSGLNAICTPILAILGVEPNDSDWAALDPVARGEAMRTAVSKLMLRISHDIPLLLVVEDMHWIDNASQTALDVLIECMERARIVLLATYRREYEESWSQSPYFSEVEVEPLSLEDTRCLVAAVLGNDRTYASIGDELAVRSGGNPFFLEEVVRSLVETNVLVGAIGAYVLDRPIDFLRIPSSVQTALSVRIDRLTLADKQLLQVAAVIGDRFTVPLLQALLRSVPQEHLDQQLRRLTAASLLVESSLYPEIRYSFRHALTSEVAYNALTEERRRSLHAAVVSAIEEAHAPKIAEYCAILAYHAAHGEVWNKLLVYARQAGTRAATQSAYREAALHFEQALVGLSHLQQSTEVLEFAIAIRFELRNALFPLGEIERDLAHMRVAEQVAMKLGDYRQQAWIASYISRDLALLGHPNEALEAAEKALALANEVNDHELRILVSSYVGHAYFALGNYKRAVDIERRILDEIAAEPIERRFGLPLPGHVMFRCWLVWALSRLGAFENVDKVWAELSSLITVLDHPLSHTVAQYTHGLSLVQRGAYEEGALVLERALELCEKWGLPAWFPVIGACLGYAYSMTARTDRGLEFLRRAVQRSREFHLMEHHALEVAWLAEACLAAGLVEEATSWSDEAIRIARLQKGRGNEAYALWVRAKVAVRVGDVDHHAMGTWIETSLAIAEECGLAPVTAKCEELMNSRRATP